MPTSDNSLIAQVELWAADKLAALTVGGVLLLRTAEPWRYQLAVGAESFARFAPFAFVKV